jgi:hypothetical protein
VVVGGEQRAQQGGEGAQQRLLGDDVPVVDDVDVRAVLGQRPDAAAGEIAESL